MSPPVLERFSIDAKALEAFCRRWQIEELSLFGSILRDDFSAASDIDVLVSFTPKHTLSVLDHLRMERELAELTGRNVEIVSRQALAESANWLTRKTILGSARRIYAA